MDEWLPEIQQESLEQGNHSWKETLNKAGGMAKKEAIKATEKV